jgi:hypothetical protein
MKMYVSGHWPVKKTREQKEQEKRLPRPIMDFDVAYSKEPKWSMTRDEAEWERDRLQSWNVHVGEHYCKFSVEELPSGSFAIACLSHPEHGKLIFDDHNAADVNYDIRFVSDESGKPSARFTGRVWHVEGHPSWHPITFIHKGPFTLVMKDGRKLKVELMTDEGMVQSEAEPR